MKIGAFYSFEDIRCEEAPIPNIGSGDILVKMRVCGVCGSELHPEYVKNKIEQRGKKPVIIGHEVSGEVIKVGKSVTKFEVGDRVAPHHHVGCLSCWYCNHGAYAVCPEFYSSNIEPGGFAEYFRVPERLVKNDTHLIPDNLSFEEAALMEPTGCVIRSIMRTPLKPGDAVAVLGTGPMGLTHIKLLTIFGGGEIIATDLSDFRLKAAKKFGATLPINPGLMDPVKEAKNITDGRGVDAVFATTIAAEAIVQAIKMLRPGGTLLLYGGDGVISPKFKLTISEIYQMCPEITITSIRSPSHIETKMALELMRTKRLKLGDLVTHRFTLEKVDEAFSFAQKRENSLKTVIINN